MRGTTLRELQDKQLLTDAQREELDTIYSGRIVSVHQELRTVLYLGVLLFSTGIGFLIYKNIGQLGHLLSIIGLFLLTIACFSYAFVKSPPYTHGRAASPNPYFDYVVLLGSLLFISALSYLQFQYAIFSEQMAEVTLATSLILFVVAYRFDHLGVLSLAITAFASFWGLQLSPQQWYSSDFFEKGQLYITAIWLGAGLALTAFLLKLRSIKPHFTFTYLNFACLAFLTGTLTGIFMNEDSYGVYLLLLLAGCALAVYGAHREKSFLFLLYAFVYGYIGITYFLADTIFRDGEIWFLYLMFSCGGFIYFIVHYRNYFKRVE